MKRLGIFSFYDKEGIVDSYIEHLLGELMTVLDRLIIVVNGQVNEAGKHVFFRCTGELIIRENKGFDAGAYADVIVNVLGGGIRDWDEIVLCNDTFFGPFVSMESVFDCMKRKKADFWGLNFVDRRILVFLQSYFLVFRKKVIQSGALLDFFKKRVDLHEENRNNLYGAFENGITHYLMERNYEPGAYTSTQLCHVYRCPGRCLQEYALPVLKRGAFSKRFRNPVELDRALRYVKDASNYDIAYILRCVKRQYGVGWTPENGFEAWDCSARFSGAECFETRARYAETDLAALIGDRPFYIYGAGEIARALFILFLHKRPGLAGFVVSDTQEIKQKNLFEFPVFHYREIPKDVLSVLCVDKQLTQDLKGYLDKKQEFIDLWE